MIPSNHPLPQPTAEPLQGGTVPVNLDPLHPVAVWLAAGASVIALCFTIVLWLRQRRLLHRYRLLLGGPRGHELEHLLLQQAEEIAALHATVRTLSERIEDLTRAAVGHIQHVGIVRFQAFPEMGSDLSFSAALLDGNHNGLVITSLFGRSESRIYGKPVQGGRSAYPLTHEEQEAIARAISKRQSA